MCLSRKEGISTGITACKMPLQVVSIVCTESVWIFCEFNRSVLGVLTGGTHFNDFMQSQGFRPSLQPLQNVHLQEMATTMKIILGLVFLIKFEACTAHALLELQTIPCETKIMNIAFQVNSTAAKTHWLISCTQQLQNSNDKVLLSFQGRSMSLLSYWVKHSSSTTKATEATSCLECL